MFKRSLYLHALLVIGLLVAIGLLLPQQGTARAHTSTARPPGGPIDPKGLSTATATWTQVPANTPTITNTPTFTATPCPMNFSDVHTTDYFYEAVRYLYCEGAISGYSDGTFRPFNNTTRGQLCKIVVLAEHWDIYTPSTPTFQD